LSKILIQWEKQGKQEGTTFVSIGQNIKYLRESYGLTQENFSHLISIERSTLSGYERDAREVSISTLCTISQMFQISIDDLVKKDFLKETFQVPSLNFDADDFIAAASEEENLFCETSPYYETSEKSLELPSPTEVQVRRKLHELYQLLDEEDKFLLTQIASCLLMQSKYLKKD
jgi:transcriptional regulator with XRE-family HTH domain